ncbi:hypothetical protein [Silanimonas sp.]|uniref:hypothetical protein n=1 Tax=Silanimonas sp. TaxID=1929290 RepID=UPI0022C5E86D|nr:hypothetical protein [Silanimonas sp.]MCZ8061760.1 hypothetical protein [Silanimonas sp.]
MIQDVRAVLARYGLEEPDLALLRADERPYRALLLQPAGPFYADSSRIGPLDLEDATNRANALLKMAAQRGDQLVVTPEYFLPRRALEEAALGDSFPAQGALWVLGCESFSPDQLDEFRTRCNDHCDVIFETDQEPEVQGSFFDPVAYCFTTTRDDKSLRRVIIFQFKTAPSRDEHSFESRYLRCGRSIYQFKNRDGLIKLSTIICSDAFAIGDDPQAIRQLADRTILIHIQLNQKPKHTDYRRYRNEIFRLSQDITNCDIVCLNWARNVVLHEPSKEPSAWKNESASAWYLPERRCSVDDAEVGGNEAKGLYYTAHEKKRHVLHFHYDEAVFALTVPKIVNQGLAILDVRIGPTLDERHVWQSGTTSWALDSSCPDTGWREMVGADDESRAAFADLMDTANRLHIERAVSLSCGQKAVAEAWFRVDRLDVFRIAECETVERATLELDGNSEARGRRRQRIVKVSILGHILRTQELPLPIRDLGGGGASINWSPNSPNTNVSKPGFLPALVTYLGDCPDPEQIKRTCEAAFELLRRENKPHKARIGVCYRTAGGETKFAEIKAQTDFTYDGSSMTSITGVA